MKLFQLLFLLALVSLTLSFGEHLFPRGRSRLLRFADIFNRVRGLQEQPNPLSSRQTFKQVNSFLNDLSFKVPIEIICFIRNLPLSELNNILVHFRINPVKKMIIDPVYLLSFLGKINVPIPDDLYVKDPCPWGKLYEGSEAVIVPLKCAANSWQGGLSTSIPLASMGECCDVQDKCYYQCGIPDFGASKAICDTQFTECAYEKCAALTSMEDGVKIINQEYMDCRKKVDMLAAEMEEEGYASYNAAQRKVCKCLE